MITELEFASLAADGYNRIPLIAEAFADFETAHRPCNLRYTASNLRALQRLLDGVALLFIEAVFLDADADHAARKNHLTARQTGILAQVGHFCFGASGSVLLRR